MVQWLNSKQKQYKGAKAVEGGYRERGGLLQRERPSEKRQQVEMSRRDKATEDTKGRKVKERGRGDREARREVVG
jgi:hypothetical protein